MINYKYITEELVEKTKYKSVYNAWNRDEFSIVVWDNKAYTVYRRALSEQAYIFIKAEMRRLYPELVEII